MRAEPAEPRGRSRRESRLRAALLAWFDETRRELPWRRDRDPYRVLVSEIMLQQTRVEVVLPAYERFLAALPTVQALAHAREDRVLSLWSGLGYYRRARSLHAAAKTIAGEHGGSFPRDVAAARRLPGVGAYTAAAVLSIAYDAPLAAVDGNVVRVLSRLERLALPDARGEPHSTLAQRLLDRTRPGDWNQAVMELGQTVCLPRGAGCNACPLRRSCDASRSDVVDLHPPPRPRRPSERHPLALVVARDLAGHVLLERGAFEHLPRMWLPVLLPVGASPATLARHGFTKTRRVGSFRHAILHRQFEVDVFATRLSPTALARLAKPPRAGHAASLSERRVFSPRELDSIGRSSLLSKAIGCSTAVAPSGK